MAIRIITDSVSDIPKKIADELNITIIPLIVNFEGSSYRDGIEITAEKLFDMIEKVKKLPTTSQITYGEFFKIFEDVIKSGDEAVVILMSSKLSGTYNSAVAAKNSLETDKITIIDSKAVTFGQGLMAIEAARMVQKGFSRKEIADKIVYMRDNMVHKFIVDNLDYLKMGGRLSATQAVVGKILNIKPILTMKDGLLIYEDKVRGKKKAIKWIIKWLKDNKINFKDKTIGIYHSNDLEYMLELKKAIIDNFDVGEIIVSKVGAVVGTHAGPGCIAVAFVK
ncbi:DegV family protein [Caminicella sporogenes]|uniref:DegV family protein n=1 Tax=Caminicella sporogenes TaxID=166485 RepID=UPI002541C907|nr:DegV family protein [Caminicella sporogenes]WIF94942.1 DegV family protein [Caminicella sporogenes]